MHILLCVLLAGILGSTNAQLYIPGLPSMSAGSGVRTNEVVRKLCNDNGGPGALDAYIKGTTDFENCFGKIMNETVAEAMQRKPTSRPLDSLLVVFCTKVPTVKSCVKSYTDTMKVCRKPEDHHELDIANRAFVRVLDFVCNNADKISEAAASTSTRTCFESKYRTLIECAENIVPTGEPSKFQPNSGSSIAMLLSTDEQGCRNLGTMQTCIVKALNGCEDKMGAELLDSLFKSVNNEVPCANLEKSHASSASVVNFALLVVAVAMSL